MAISLVIGLAMLRVHNPLSITINQDTSIVANFVTSTNNISDNNSWSILNLGNGWRSFSWFGEFFEVSQIGSIMQILAGFTGMVTTLIHYGCTSTRLAFHYKIDFPHLHGHSLKAWLYSYDRNFLLWME